MADTDPQQNEGREARLAEQADRKQISFLQEYLHFLRSEKRWWMAPVLIGLLIIGAVVILGGTPAATFIYALF